MASNEIVITVRARTAVREGFDAARKEAEAAGKDAGESYTEHFVNTVTKRMAERIKAPLARVGQEMGAQLGESVSQGLTGKIYRSVNALGEETKEEAQSSGEIIGENLGESAGRSFTDRIRDKFRRLSYDTKPDTDRAGDEIGESLGSRISEKINTSIKEIINRSPSGGLDNDRDVDRDKDVDKDVDRNLLSRMFSRGGEAAKAFSTGFGQAVSTFFSGDLISLLVKVLAGGALAMALAPVIGAAISAAVLLGLGGGVIGAGIAAAFKDPQIAGAAGELKDKLSKMFVEFGKPFVPYVAITMEKLAGFVDRIAPKMKEVAEFMAPVVGALGQGFVEMLDNMMPGILEAVAASKPLFETLARHLPDIGKAVGEFFSVIADNGDQANLFFSDFLSLITDLIPIIGAVISAFAAWYSVTRTFITTAIGMFEALLGTIKWMASGAKSAFLSFVSYALDKLGQLLAGAATALSWIPGIGPKLKEAEKKFNEFRKDVNDELGKIKDKTVTINMQVLGMAAANAAIDVGRTLSAMGYAHGGIRGAANGATSSGLTLVGEHGPELAEVKPGGRVWSNPDTERMLGQGGGGPREIEARWVDSGNSLMDEIAKHIRIYVKDMGGGNVQASFGQG